MNYEQRLKALQEENNQTRKQIRTASLGFLSDTGIDLYEIEMLQGTQRAVRLAELKAMVLEYLLESSNYKTVLTPAQFENFKTEITTLLSLD